jgi:tetratricopeptide (TPR) repeat protein
MEATNNAFSATARNRALVFLLIALGVMFFSAVVYRVENPSLVRREEAREMPASRSDASSMAGISSMMKKLQDDPDNVDLMRALGMAFMDMQAWDKSISFWDMVLKKNEADIMALNQKGFCLFELEKYAEAGVLFEKMLAIEEQNPRAHFNLGIIYKYYLSDPEKARTHFQAVVDAAADAMMAENARRELEDN